MLDHNSLLVSVGLPVFNEKEKIGRAIESWLAQDYPNFEIILADNASTDGTREICRNYSDAHERIRLFENVENIGPVRNHHLTFYLSRGEFFIWAGGHDHVHPSFIRKTLNVLQENPSVVMCSVRSEFRGDNDVAWRTTKGGFDSRGMPKHERFAALINHLTSGATANFFYGLYRRRFLSDLIDNQKKIIGADVVMLANLALLGDIIQLDDILYYRYVPQNPEGKARIKRHIQHIIGGEGFQVNALMPNVGMLFGYMQVIEESNLPEKERQHMYMTVLREARRINVILSKEVCNFMSVGNNELILLNDFPGIQAYRATQILDGVNKLRSLGFDTKEMNSIALMSSRILRKRSIHIQSISGEKFSFSKGLMNLFRKTCTKIRILTQRLSGGKQ